MNFHNIIDGRYRISRGALLFLAAALIGVALGASSCKKKAELQTAAGPSAEDRAEADRLYAEVFELAGTDPANTQIVGKLQALYEKDPAFDRVKGSRELMQIASMIPTLQPLALREGFRFLEQNPSADPQGRIFGTLVAIAVNLSPFREIQGEFLSKEDWEGAEKRYIELLQTEKDPFRRYLLHRGLAGCYKELGKIDEAIETARKAIPYFPEKLSDQPAAGNKNFCTYYFKLIYTEEAGFGAKEEALRRAPECEPFYSEFVQGALAGGGTEEDMNALLKANREQIDSPMTDRSRKLAMRLETAGILIALGQYDKAIGEIKAFQMDAPDGAGLMGALADYMTGYAEAEAVGDPAAAAPYYEKLQASDSPMIAAFGAGLLAFQDEKWDEALAAFEKAAEILSQERPEGIRADLFLYYQGRVYEEKEDWTHAFFKYSDTLKENERQSFFWVVDAVRRAKAIKPRADASVEDDSKAEENPEATPDAAEERPAE